MINVRGRRKEKAKQGLMQKSTFSLTVLFFVRCHRRPKARTRENNWLNLAAF